MRDPKKVYAIAAVLAKRLHCNVTIMQTERFTEWRLENGKGFAIGPCIDSYPLRKLLDTLTAYFTPPMPVRRKRKGEEDDD